MPLFDCVKGVSIPAIACALPEQHFSLMEYAPDLLTEKTARYIAKATGFHTLRIAPDDMTASDLFVSAAERILEDYDRQKIAALVLVTQTPDYIMPATSHTLQHRLNLSNNVLCLDINEGCSGFITGLYISAGLCSKLGAPVLLGCGDTLSKTTSPKDRATRCIFGDEVAAVLIEPGTQDIPFAFTSYGDRQDVIIMENSRHRFTENPKNDGFIYLDGIEILNFSLNELPEVINDFMARNNISQDDISLYACHQANKLIIDSLADKLGVPHDKMPFTSGDTGNESSASIPSVIVRQGEGDNTKSVLCFGFGVGLSVGVCLADFSKTKTSEVYVS